MLTSDLAINYRRGDQVFPRFINPDGKDYLTDAANLIEIFEDFLGFKRGALEAELEEYVGTGTNYRILRGFIKLLDDRCEFEVSSPADPIEIRQKVFLEARRHQPVLPGSAQKEEVLKTIAEELETDPDSVFENLYSDLNENQRLTRFETISPRNLIDRYNLAQAQALLYKCLELKIRIFPSSASNYRSIFGWIKHFGLIHSIGGNSAKGYQVTLTGAASLFHRSQKYGIQMSVFLPALLLCTDWEMSAEIAQKKGRNLFYRLSFEQDQIRSCYEDEPEYVNSDIEKLEKNWEKSSTDWKLEENREVIDLGKTAFIPDFSILSPAGEKIYLDVLGFWTPKDLKRRLEEFEKAGFDRFIIAAGQDLRGTREEPLWESPNVLFYKTSIPVNPLVEMGVGMICDK
ncbi:MAG: DUF790 family protein [Pyrinomonadaceae bacterium]